MTDVFISYSRKDKAFVQRLDEALQKRNREAWVARIREMQQVGRAVAERCVDTTLQFAGFPA